MKVNTLQFKLVELEYSRDNEILTQRNQFSNGLTRTKFNIDPVYNLLAGV